MQVCNCPVNVFCHLVSIQETENANFTLSLLSLEKSKTLSELRYF